MVKVLINYLKSPIFIAVVAGIAFSRFPSVVNLPVLDPFWEALKMIEGTLTVIACLILGLQLKFRMVRNIIPLFIVSSLIQIGLQPLLVSFGADIFHVSMLDKEVLILISAMPSVVLSTVFTTQYDCDAENSSALVFLNIIVSLIGIPIVCHSLFH